MKKGHEHNLSLGLRRGIRKHEVLSQPVATGIGQQAHPRTVIHRILKLREKAVSGGPLHLWDDIMQRMADFDLPSRGVERESVPRPTRVRFCDSQFLDPHNGAYPLLSHVLDLVS